jgi:hypothetical protein
MKYNLADGRVIKIPDDEIEKSMQKLELTREEAIDLWLEDNEYEINEEQQELDDKAKKVKIQHDAGTNVGKKTQKERIVKVSDEKKALFDVILTNLDRCEGVEREKITVLKENKLIQCTINGKVFKIDVIEQRPKKR